MPVTFGMKLDYEREDIQGKSALLAIGNPGAKARLVDCATRQLAYAQSQLDELGYHNKRIQAEGVADSEVAASLKNLLEGARQAEEDAKTLLAFILASHEFGPLGRENLQ